MAHRRRFTSNRAPGPRRQTEWLSLAAPDAFTTLNPNSKIQFSTGLTATELDKLPFTITRTIGLLVVKSDQVAVQENTFGAMGICVVSERALTVGITALPDPLTEANADFWFVFEPWSVIREVSNNSGTMSYMKVFDSRAQRKVEEGEQLAFIIANSNSGFGIQFGISLRMLIKLH